MSESGDENPFGDLDDEMAKAENNDAQVADSESNEPTSSDSKSESATDAEPDQSDSATTSDASSSPIIRNEVHPSPSVVTELSDRTVPGAYFGKKRYPYAIRRSGWDDERSGNKKFVMREETEKMEALATEEIKTELFPDTSLNITDVREAATIVGLQNLDDVVDVLNQWGFAEEQDLHE